MQRYSVTMNDEYKTNLNVVVTLLIAKTDIAIVKQVTHTIAA